MRRMGFTALGVLGAALGLRRPRALNRGHPRPRRQAACLDHRRPGRLVATHLRSYPTADHAGTQQRPEAGCRLTGPRDRMRQRGDRAAG